MRKRILTLMIMISFIVLTGCTLLQSDFPPPGSKTDPSPEQKEGEKEPSLIPLDLDIDEFENIYGWMDNQTILYSFVRQGKYHLATYHLYKGESKVIFTSDSPFHNILIHKSKEMLLIHTSQNSQSAKVYFIDDAGDVKFSTSIESHELAFEWNEENANLMMTTAFFEDWSYKSFAVDVGDKSIQELEGIHPFVKWFGEDHILVQDWNPEQPNLFAPLVKQSLSDPSQREVIFNHLYRFDVFSNLLMTIEVPDVDSEHMEYHFYDSLLKPIGSSIQVPNLTQYSDWLIPYYDYLEENETFLTFVAKHHENADVYTEGFQLVAYHLKQQHKEILFEDMENKPIICSPNGELCLYGHQLEELLNLKTAERLKLIH
ncbi:hypothetical protein MUB24_21535 [Lederbergia sp. NSJ-179]|uniref:YqgU-like beta propeller domain-containing protein n=1 Tax=Lederbergia sp. NSJ-179 TaxID=2931402 RepID=UPI001FD1E18B|nr:hypothetical protein [Lederbergia sp. NSJ-179]MCJ7843408.1 hypothetical protein [Lederbergia sp. NSJ-179]